ncbi:MAG: TRAP transporter small permease [Alphaproteobacteria bacterium]|nr:TRAP transporter small permease [Alphaproteobacteria bacterium]
MTKDEVASNCRLFYSDFIKGVEEPVRRRKKARFGTLGRGVDEGPDAVTSALDILAGFNRSACLLARNLAACLVAVMTAAVLAGVFFRYVLNNSLAWTEDSSILMMIWVAFLIAPYAYRQGGHVGIELVVTSFPKPVFRIIRIITNLVILWLLYRFMQEAVIYVMRGFNMRANTIPVPIAFFRTIVPISLGMMMLIGVELILRDMLSLIDRDRDHDLADGPSTVTPE